MGNQESIRRLLYLIFLAAFLVAISLFVEKYLFSLSLRPLQMLRFGIALRLTLLLIFGLCILYKRRWDFTSVQRRIQKLHFWIIFLTAVLIFKFVVDFCADAQFMYAQIRYANHGFSNGLFVSDPLLGWRTASNVTGYEIIPGGKHVPVKLDERGFRVPVSDHQDNRNRPRLLFIGASHTFGQTCVAEDSFPWRTGLKLGGYSINAGVGGYNYSHMLLSAKQRILAEKPDVVIVQASPWLVDRALSRDTCRAANWGGKLPVPYFFRARSGQLEIARPLYQVALNKFPFDECRANPDNVLNKIGFLFRVFIPTRFYEIYARSLVFFKDVWGLLPSPITSRDLIEREFFYQMHKMCSQHGTLMVVVTVNYGYGAHARDVLRDYPDVILVDAGQELLRRTRNRIEYAFRYQLCMRNENGTLFLADKHLNAAANEIISDMLSQSIRDAINHRAISLYPYDLKGDSAQNAF